MLTVAVQPDANGTFIGSSFCHATARDWARLGQLYLNNGRWRDQQVLSEKWVQFTVTPGAASLVRGKAAKHSAYGAQMWLNADFEDAYVPCICVAHHQLAICGDHVWW